MDVSLDVNLPAIKIEGAASVINQGAILSNSHAISVINGANNVSIVNSGEIYGLFSHNGIWVSSAAATNVTITNSGEISGEANGIHIQGAPGAAPVIINGSDHRSSKFHRRDGRRPAERHQHWNSRATWWQTPPT